jgi:ZIP family zinc transporter
MEQVTIIEVIFWSIISVLGIIIGAFIGIKFHFSHKSIAKVMALAAGLLIAAATIELTSEAIKHIDISIGLLSMLIGGLGFSFGNALLAKKEAQNRKRCGVCVAQPNEKDVPGSGLAITMGTAMDAIPEAIVLGLSFFSQGLNLPLILAIALGNLPEALSGSAGMLEAGRTKTWILKVWGSVALMTVILTLLGFTFAKYIPTNIVSMLELFGAGALIAMVSETLIPEAFHSTPRYSGTLVTIGFMLILLVQALLH